MINKLFLKNNIQQKYIKGSSSKHFSKRFEKTFLEVSNEIKSINKTLNVLHDKFKFNFKIKDLKKFKQFRTIAIIGMGGSILGAEAIYGFF